MPARKPDEVKKREGTWRKDRARPHTPKVKHATVPPPPRTLGRAERAVWLELAAAVNGLGVYAPSDYPLFRLLVRAVALAHDPDAPASAQARAIQNASALAGRFGLSPVDRARVQVGQSVDEDPTERELFGPLRAVK